MGRYGKELRAAKEDPAGKYLEQARQRRKERPRSGLAGLGWNQEQLSKAAVATEEWPICDA